MHFLSRAPSLACTALAALVLMSGCQRREDNRTVGQRLDDGVSQIEQKNAEISAQAREAAQAASVASSRTADAVSSKTRDMGITAEMNARLAKDRQLSALRIDVDTAEGRVTLRGSAPTLAAREHATEIARGIDGVVGVANELQVQAPVSSPS
jgi:hyperosmotically inducible periplasmic protein